MSFTLFSFTKTILPLLFLCHATITSATPVEYGRGARGAPSPPGSNPIACTNQGTYRGTHLNDDVSAFLGVPYAKPPVGDLRWRPAEPLPTKNETHEGPVDATGFGPVCWQFHYRTVLLNNTLQTTPQSEDCLNLNVFVPRDHEESTKLPVFLWSYGGAFTEGGGSEQGKQCIHPPR